MSGTFGLFARDARTREAFRDAAVRAGLDVLDVTAEPSSIVDAGAAVFRVPGGLMAAALAAGAQVALYGPTPDWFVGLDPELTGRSWVRCVPARARELVSAAPHVVKLADGKHRRFASRRYSSVDALDVALHELGEPPGLELLATSTWLAIDSEYRTFVAAGRVLTTSPYRVQDDPWTPLIHTHRASFHEEAAVWCQSLLDLLGDDAPPAAVLDIARLADGRFVLLEANQSWGAGLYGCDGDRALQAVLIANGRGPEPVDERWRWRPDPALDPG